MVAPAQTETLAHWTYTYASSGNFEVDELYRDNTRLYYTQTGFDKGSAHSATPPVTSSMPLDNIREVTVHQNETEIDVQVWGIRNLSIIVLHFNFNQRKLAERTAEIVQQYQYGGGYFPMQKRAKIAVKSSSLATSPVK